MNDTIITALIMAFGSIICQILINRSNRDKRAREDHEKDLDRAKKEAEKETRLEDRLGSIEKKLDEHNGYAKKFEEVAGKFADISSALSSIKTSIDFIKER